VQKNILGPVKKKSTTVLTKLLFKKTINVLLTSWFRMAFPGEKLNALEFIPF